MRRPSRSRPGRSRWTVSSSRSLPSATSCMTTVATKLFVTLPTQNRSSGRAFRRRADVGVARGDDRAPAVLLDERDHGGDLARGDEPVGVALELGLGRRRRAGEEGGRRERERRASRMCLVRGEPAPRYSVTFGPLGVYEGQMASDYSVELPLPLAARRRRGRARRAGGQRATTRPTRRSFGRTSASPTASPPRSPAGTRTREEATQNAFVKAYRSLPPLPRRRRLQAVAAPDRRQRGAQRAPRRAAARAARRARRRAARGGDRGRGRSGHRARGGRDGPRRARATLRTRTGWRSPFATSPSCPTARPPRWWARRQEAYRVRLLRARRRLQALLEEADV